MYSQDMMQTVKLGQKQAGALKAKYHLLASFGQNRRPTFLALKQDEWTYS